MHPSTPLTLFTIPCFSGAPWNTTALAAGHPGPVRTMRLPEALDNIEDYANAVAASVGEEEHYALVGDSFGAIIALALAVRRPQGLRALVMSGGFAANPVDDPLTRLQAATARFLPGPLYRQIVLRLHARALASPHDATGEVPWSLARSRQLFLDATPHASYVARVRAAFAADYRARLPRVNVPTLILTPGHDTLIGADAVKVLRAGIPQAREIVLNGAGHMFRFSHPRRYAAAILGFLAAEVSAPSLEWTTTKRFGT